jgi:hypothetical protein
MRKILWITLFAFLFSMAPASAQSNAVFDSAQSKAASSRASARDSIPSKESFVNAIVHIIVDSSFSRYCLFTVADPCSFTRFDYGEWTKYALMEDVPIYTLNELAEKAYHDRKPLCWQQQALDGANCVGKAKADSMLNPLTGLDTTLNVHHRKAQARHIKAQARLLEEKWDHLPAQQRIVFYFSRPAITGDGQFAVIDLGYRCDSRLCGIGTTCLFRHTPAGWKLIGRKVNWGG